MRKELFWDRDLSRLTPEAEIERAINFGGFKIIEEVRNKYGREKFTNVLLTARSLSKRSVNYWCLVLGIDRNLAAVFKSPRAVWSPFR